MGKFLVIGSGISGCSMGLELAREGHSVVILESSYTIGGKVVSYCCKATNECSRCGVCIAHTTIAEALSHPRIVVMPGSSIASVRNGGNKIFVNAERAHPYVVQNKCLGCDACIAACPCRCIEKYHRGGLVYYSINHVNCLRRHGKQCLKCITACPAGAIDGRGKSGDVSLVVDRAIIASGHSAYDPSVEPRFGFGRLEGVMTAEKAEEILSSRNYLRTPSDDVAFIQCVGSRNPRIGHNYCSAVCCAYAARMARIIKYRNPGSRVMIYFIDLQNFDKTFTAVRRCISDEGIGFIRAVPVSIDRTANGRLKIAIDSPAGKNGYAEHDIVVLSVGMQPPPGTAVLARLFDLERDEFGFLRSKAANVHVAGTCVEPQSINDCIASAKALAADIVKLTPRPSRIRAEALSGHFKIKRMPLRQHILVVGGGIAGIQTARELMTLGHAVTLVESAGKIGGDTNLRHDNPVDFAALTAGMHILTESRLSRLSGSCGSFTADLATPAGKSTLECGAIAACSGTRAWTEDKGLLDFGAVVEFADLYPAMRRCSRKNRPQSVGMILDMNIEETIASLEMAMQCALSLRTEYRNEIFLLCREVRVASLHLQQLYDTTRNAGVNILKYEGDIVLNAREDDVCISAHGADLNAEIDVVCQIAAVSRYGVDSSADPALAVLLDIASDSLGQMQGNNIHLFPDLTNRPGIFVVGACRGQYYLPHIIRDAKAAALRIHAFLSQKRLAVELSNAAVDAAKCALCLTCIRVCPHRAMIIDDEKRAAMSIPEACQKCGICVGECPAAAINLPEQNS